MKRAIVRLFRLPVDVILLTVDFLSLTRWKLTGLLAGLFGVMGPHSGPFCRKRLRCVDGDGRLCQLCGHAQRYGNRELFSLLCRWVSVVPAEDKGPAGVCLRHARFTISTMHYITSAVLLGFFWTSVARLIVRVWF